MLISRFNLVETKAKNVNVGQRFGRLIIIALGQKKNTYKYYAICQCDCGSSLKKIRIDNLTSNAVISCGCFHKEQVTTNGISGSIHYARWHGMMDRCYNVKCQAYKNYGGRGIKVYHKWHDAKKFINDLPSGYFKGAEIDRIDNNGSYVPGNIKWSTSKENSRNKRSNHILKLNGKKQTIVAWSEDVNIKAQVIYERIASGWTVKDALTKPVSDSGIRKDARINRSFLKFKYKGESLTAIEIHEKYKPNITLKMLRARIVDSGWSVEKALSSEIKKCKTFLYNDKDHSIAELSELSGISVKLLRKRILERKWTVEKALTTKVKLLA